MTKILQITDTHIVPKGELAYETVDTAKALAETVSTVNRLLQQFGPVDLIVFTGDLTENGTSEEYELFKELVRPLSVPYAAVPGNHDDRQYMRESWQNETWMPSEGPINWSLDLPDFAVICLDSLVDGKAHGVFTDETLAYLETELAKFGEKPLLVGFHHPPFDVGIGAMDSQKLTTTDPFAAILSGYPGEIRLICGHLHRTISGLFAGRLCQVCPGTSHAVTLEHRSDAANSLTVEPGGFMLHEWRDGRFLSHQISVGTYPGPYPFAGYALTY